MRYTYQLLYIIFHLYRWFFLPVYGTPCVFSAFCENIALSYVRFFASHTSHDDAMNLELVLYIIFLAATLSVPNYMSL
jgi:putative component of membrane protein insertase Oxa1/YidC/SpoIIIJ protein YidD